MATVILPVELREEQARQDAARLQRSIDDLRQSVDRLGPAFRTATSQFASFGNASSQVRRARTEVEGVNRSLRSMRRGAALAGRALGAIGLAGGIGAGISFAARQFVRLTDSAARTNTLFRQITDSAEDLADQQGRVYDLAVQLRVPVEGVAALYTRTALALQGAYPAEQIQRFTRSITQLGIASGASGIEFAQAARQLTQGIGSGILAGEELKALLEGLPEVGRALARELGVSFGELRTLGAAGRLTGERVFTGLSSENVARAAAEQYRSVNITFGQAADAFNSALQRGFTEFQQTGNHIENLNTTLQSEVVPAVLQLAEGFLFIAGLPAVFERWRQGLEDIIDDIPVTAADEDRQRTLALQLGAGMFFEAQTPPPPTPPTPQEVQRQQTADTNTALEAHFELEIRYDAFAARRQADEEARAAELDRIAEEDERREREKLLYIAGLRREYYEDEQRRARDAARADEMTREAAERAAEAHARAAARAQQVWSSTWESIGQAASSAFRNFEDNAQGWLRLAQNILGVLSQIQRTREFQSGETPSNSTSFLRGLFSFFHDGRMPTNLNDRREIPAIIRANEAVFTPDQLQSFAGGGMRVSVQQNISVQRPDDPQFVSQLRRNAYEVGAIVSATQQRDF